MYSTLQDEEQNLVPAARSTGSTTARAGAGGGPQDQSTRARLPLWAIVLIAVGSVAALGGIITGIVCCVQKKGGQEQKPEFLLGPDEGDEAQEDDPQEAAGGPIVGGKAQPKRLPSKKLFGGARGKPGLENYLNQLKAQGHTKVALAYSQGSLNPMHMGHVEIFDKVSDGLKQKGFTNIPVVGFWHFNPESFVRNKLEAKYGKNTPKTKALSILLKMRYSLAHEALKNAQNVFAIPGNDKHLMVTMAQKMFGTYSVYLVNVNGSDDMIKNWKTEGGSKFTREELTYFLDTDGADLNAKNKMSLITCRSAQEKTEVQNILDHGLKTRMTTADAKFVQDRMMVVMGKENYSSSKVQERLYALLTKVPAVKVEDLGAWLYPNQVAYMKKKLQ
ncbi:unnamed protein product [Amoebophrya sp. A25]|nr:unnamed protein product [Amoebophrya sp. A25]|eukprot:GSA25T00001389001.1